MLAFELTHAQGFLVAQAFAFHRCLDAGAQQHRVEWFGQVVFCAQFDAAHGIFEAGAARDHDHGGPRVVRGVAQHGQNFHAVHFGHFHVEQHQVEMLSHQGFDGFASVARFGDVGQANLYQRTAQPHADQAAVIHQKHFGFFKVRRDFR